MREITKNTLILETATWDLNYSESQFCFLGLVYLLLGKQYSSLFNRKRNFKHYFLPQNLVDKIIFIFLNFSKFNIPQ